MNDAFNEFEQNKIKKQYNYDVMCVLVMYVIIEIYSKLRIQCHYLCTR